MARLDELKRHARQAFASGDNLLALRLADAAVTAQPLDFESRLKVADCLVALGETNAAIEVYRAVGFYALKANHPLIAITVSRVVETLAGEASDLLATLVVTYGSESEVTSKRATRIPLPEGKTDVHVPDLKQPVAADFARAAAGRATHCLDDYDTYPETVHEIPLLSRLSEEAFRRVLSTLVVRRLPAGSPVIRQGEPGTSFFFVALGQVVVTATVRGAENELAVLAEGAVFGEMALLSASPRNASVTVRGEADLLEMTRESLQTLAEELEAIAVALHAFTRDRLLKNLMATHPLFRPFSKVQQRHLLSRFTAHDVGPNTDIIHEGDEGRGLFVLLSGEAQVSKQGEPLATLRAGDVFGEIALVRGGPTSATVVASTQATVMFLARENVNSIVAGVPEIRRYLEALADDRELDNQLAFDVDESEDEVIIMI